MTGNNNKPDQEGANAITASLSGVWSKRESESGDKLELLQHQCETRDPVTETCLQTETKPHWSKIALFYELYEGHIFILQLI